MMQKMKNMTEKLLLFFLLFICLAKASTSTPSPLPNIHNQTQSPKHFVLIHGGCLGAWSWYKVATLLKYSGHRVTALDLGASGINPIQVEQHPSLSEFVEPLTRLMVSLPPKEKVILVAHSYGGAVISIFMERFSQKISAAVYVTAIMSGPTLNFSTIFAEATKRFDFKDSQFRYDNGTNNPATSFIFGPKDLATSLYQLSPPYDLTLGLLLVRFVPLYNYDVIKLTKEKYGSVPRVFIVSLQDHTIVLDVQKFTIKNNPPNEVKVINGSDHMVMLSKPVELFFHLQNIAEKYHKHRHG
ncbi:methyl jasmonate esterase 1-like [Pyrus x bretschneideri]|uniref:methyl jasmonate esterase 1-like n=1 Tax=Pyrus x bretschneideri TaxID=225117 RepID=UPI00202DF0F7|nr:methyl jasmonate esterase 1-like [Pyrus x bretschneideri]